MINYDKNEVKENLTLENHFELLEEFGANPQYSSNGIIAETICHNPPGEGSKKLYYYSNSDLYICYSGCDDNKFDIFELVIRVFSIQHNQVLDLNKAIRWVAQRFGIIGQYTELEEETLEDWNILKEYDRIQEINYNENKIILKEYDTKILHQFNYNVIIEPWIKENISPEVMRYAGIGYYPAQDIITIPHFDEDNRFIGLRGRTLIKEEAELYGKYRPVNFHNTLFTHSLGLNLYGLNWAKNNISLFKKAIVFESEKSVLQYMSMMGIENNIAVACCGSNFSPYQFQLLKRLGVNEIIIAFDKDFEQINDATFIKQTKNLKNIYKKFGKYVTISFIFDRYNNKLSIKSSPIETDKETFLELYKNRIYLKGD